MLRCPICFKPLALEGKTYRCENNHCFDVSKAGYVNLSRKQSAAGDNKAMIQARTRFLEHGYYGFFRQAVMDLIEKIHPEVLVDLACGQGWYIREFAKRAKTTYGVDLSKPAVEYAAKHDHESSYLVASIFDLPFDDESVDVMTCLFAPVPAKEAARVLKKDGLLITAGPGVHHLEGLKSVLYDKVRLNDEPKNVDEFHLKDRFVIEQEIVVEDPIDLLAMTPYAYRTPKEGVQRLEKQTNLKTPAQFVISVWEKNHES